MSFKKRLLSYIFTAPSQQWLTEVEWLKTPYDYATSNRPYINTGIVADWDVPTEIVATITKTVANRTVIIGNYANSLTFSLETTATNRLRMYVSNSTSVDPSYVTVDALTNSSYPIQLNKPTKVWLKFTPLNDSAHTVNYELGLEVLTTSVTTTAKGSFSRYGQTPTSRTLRLFNDYRATVDTFNGGFKLHQLEVKVGTKHQKYIPCLDKNGNPCMYEQISGNLFYNEDPISFFNYGRKITEVEWINLTGQQWFDTGFYPNTLSTTMKATFELIGENSLGKFPYGVRRVQGYADSCSSYIAPINAAAQYGYLRLDWALKAGTPRYNFTSLTEKINVEMTGNYANVNGTEYTDSTVTSFDHPATFQIGNCYTESSDAYQSGFQGKYYVLELLNTYSREDYRYCVPAHDENNIGFFFDRTNHYILDNKGGNTADMTWGEEIHPVNYIYGGYPSSFKTLGTTFAAHKWETDMKAAGDNNSQILLGSATGAANYWGVSSTANAYMLHTTSTAYWIYMDAKERRTVCLDSNDLGNSKGTLTMEVDGQTMSRTASSGYNTSTSYNLFYFNSNYTGKMWVYGNRCYDRTTNQLLLNWVPVQNGDKVCKFLETITHTLIDAVSYPEELTPGYNMIGYQMGNELPYGFVEVDYLESTGTQYIDMGVVLDSDYDVEIEARQTNTTTGISRFLFGDNSSTTNAYMIACSSSNDCYVFDLKDNRTISSVSGYDGKFHTHKIENRSYYIDGVLQGTSSYVGTHQTTGCYLFGAIGNIANNYWQIRKCKIFNENGRIIADYVPCLRIYDNKPGMFDLISRKFLTNAGTGEFIVGIDGIGYTPVDYLQSSGEQYIDLGLYIDNTCGYYIDAQGLESSDKMALGTKGNGNSRWCYNPSSYNVNLSWNTAYSADNIETTPGTTTARHKAKMNVFNDRQRVLDMIVKNPITEDLSPNASEYTICLFAAKWGSETVGYYFKGKIYSCYITKASDYIGYYLPMVRASDSKPGMFDLISRTLLVNGGTGTDFTVVLR